MPSLQLPIQPREAVELPEEAELPDHIQWMPPGKHTITVMKGDELVTMDVNVTPEAAARIQSVFEAYVAAADAGTGDRPYFDFNHDDAEASAWPTEFFWGGDDPQTGGIRARVEWSTSGAHAVRGRNYRRFSPSFYRSENNEIIGAAENMGGLVNRAAFQSIQPILAKLGRTSKDPVWLVKARAIATSEQISMYDALHAAGERDPQVYACYRAHLLGQQQPALTQSTLDEEPPFAVQAKVVAAAKGIDLVEAAEILAKANNRAYEEYRAALMGVELEDEPTSETSPRQDRVVARAAIMAAAHGISFVQACERYFAAKPAAYNVYRAKLLGDPDPVANDADLDPFELKVKEIAEEWQIPEELATAKTKAEHPELWMAFFNRSRFPNADEIAKELGIEILDPDFENKYGAAMGLQ